MCIAFKDQLQCSLQMEAVAQVHEHTHPLPPAAAARFASRHSDTINNLCTRGTSQDIKASNYALKLIVAISINSQEQMLNTAQNYCSSLLKPDVTVKICSSMTPK